MMVQAPRGSYKSSVLGKGLGGRMQLHTIMAGRGFGRIPTLSRSIVVLRKGRKHRPCSGGR